MRMNKVLLSPEAARDLAEIKQYISKELKNPGAAKKAVQTITKELRTLARFPEAGPSVEALTGYPTNIRLFACGKRIALYRIEDATVQITRIIDSRQDYFRILFGDDFWEHEGQPESETEARVQMAKSLFGLIPSDTTIDEARDERLKNITD